MKRFSVSTFRIGSPPRKDTFRRHTRSIRHRLRAVHTLLEGDPEQMKNAVPLLHGAFLDLLHGMVLECMERTQACRASLAPPSPLSRWNAIEWVKMPDWLRVAAKQYYQFASVEPTRNQITDTIRILHSQLDAVHHWRDQRSERAVFRYFRKLAVAPTVLIGILLVGAVSFGVYEYTTRADEADGLAATYFSETQFQGHPFMWIDPHLRFDWQKHAPFRTRQPFSVRWQGCLAIQSSAKHVQLDTNADFTLTVDGTSFSNAAPERALPRGTHFLTVELPVVRIPTHVTLKWNTPGAPNVPIPSKALVPLGGNDHHDCSPEAALQRRKGGK